MRAHRAAASMLRRGPTKRRARMQAVRVEDGSYAPTPSVTQTTATGARAAR